MDYIESSLIFTGISGAGKTKLVGKLAEEYHLRVVDVFEYVKPYIEKYGSTKVKGGILKKPYKDLISDLPNLNFDILEIASDWPDEFLPQIIKKLKVKPILIFCDVSLETSLERNRKRNRVVPEQTLRDQARFDHGFYKKLASDFGVELIIIDNEKPISDSCQDLKNKLKL